ncbi:MAG: hypothetical protein WC606_01920 [Candidatus Absconditabacterales bacterium]|jgi:hypothetical protein
MLKKSSSLWDVKPGIYVALNHKREIIAEGNTPEKANTEAVIKGEGKSYILSGYELQRHALLPAEMHQHPLILIAHNWKNGKIFFVKKVEFKDEDLALVHGIYLNDLIDCPWAILGNVYLSSIRIRKKPYRGSFEKDNNWYAYEPVIDEVKPFLPDIRYYIKNSIFEKTVLNYRNQNHLVKLLFKNLRNEIQ